MYFAGYIVPLIILAFLLVSALRILREYERAVVFTLGRFTGIKGPGIFLLVPLAQKMDSLIANNPTQVKAILTTPALADATDSEKVVSTIQAAQAVAGKAA